MIPLYCYTIIYAYCLEKHGVANIAIFHPLLILSLHLCQHALLQLFSIMRLCSDRWSRSILAPKEVVQSAMDSYFRGSNWYIYER